MTPLQRSHLLRVEARNRARFTLPPPRQGWFKRHDTAIKSLLAIAGLLITLNEYLQRQHDTRIQRSLGIYERYQSKEVLKARLDLDRVWNTPAFWEKLKARHAAGDRLYYDQTTDLAEHLTQNRTVVDALFVVWTISAEASLCLIRGQCDQVTICQTFWHDTKKYHGFFESYFNARNFAWEETVQNREQTTINILNSHCGAKRYRALFDQAERRTGFIGFWDTLQRRYYESFNILLTKRPTKTVRAEPSETN